MCSMKMELNRHSVSVLRKVVDIWAQQPGKLHPPLLCSWSTVLMGWDCLWLGPSHYVCFTFRESGHVQTCTKTEFLWVQTLYRQLEDCEEQFIEFDNRCMRLELQTQPLISSLHMQVPCVFTTKCNRSRNRSQTSLWGEQQVVSSLQKDCPTLCALLSLCHILPLCKPDNLSEQLENNITKTLACQSMTPPPSHTQNIEHCGMTITNIAQYSLWTVIGDHGPRQAIMSRSYIVLEREACSVSGKLLFLERVLAALLYCGASRLVLKDKSKCLRIMTAEENIHHYSRWED